MSDLWQAAQPRGHPCAETVVNRLMFSARRRWTDHVIPLLAAAEGSPAGERHVGIEMPTWVMATAHLWDRGWTTRLHP